MVDSDVGGNGGAGGSGIVVVRYKIGSITAVQGVVVVLSVTMVVKRFIRLHPLELSTYQLSI